MRISSRWCVAIALATSAVSARAQAIRPDSASVFGDVTGGFFALSVPDLAASAKWYEEKLGMHRVMTVGRMGEIAGVIALETGNLIVEMIQRDDASAASGTPELTHGIAKAGIIVADFDRTVAALRARGITFMNGPFPARPNARANVMFKDNAGNVIQVFGGYAK